MYKLTKGEYSHLLDNAVTATYKKATEGIKDIINRKGIKYAKRAYIYLIEQKLTAEVVVL